MQRQVDHVRRIKVGVEFRANVTNDRQLKVRSDFSGTPIYIKCTSGTGLVPPTVTPPDDDNCTIIRFPETYLMGQPYEFVIDELQKVVKSYEKPPVKKSIAGQQYFRAEIRESQESLKRVFTASEALSFDQSYFTRTIGQIMIQYRLENKLGPLHEHYHLFSGAGFGALQALSCAVGYDSEELNRFFTGDLLNGIKKGLLTKGYEITTSVLFNHDHDRFKADKIKKQLRKYFKAKNIDSTRNDRDLTLKDCKKDVYIPVWDISRMTATLTKQVYPDMPVYIACAASMLDHIWFESKPILDGGGIMAGDIAKNNDVYIKKYNPCIQITSVGAPVRLFDKGTARIDERSKLLKAIEARHDNDADMSRACSKRYECTPIDEYFQFATSDQAIQAAQKSGDIDV